MNHRVTLRCFRLGAVALALLSSAAYAGQIAITPSHGENIVAMLDSDAQMFVDGMRAAMTEDRNMRPPFSRKAKDHLFKATKRATVARMEYVYTKAGQEFSRVYYGRSGPAMAVTFRRMDATSGGSSDPYRISEDDIRADIEERRFYAPDSSTRVRVTNLPVREGGIVATEEIHRGDAELKIFRKIEADIEANVVPRGGRLVGYVSKAVCPSCRAASETLATKYDVDGNVYELVEAGAEPSANEAIRASEESSRLLRTRREKYFNDNVFQTFRPVDRTSRIVPDPVEHIEAEEARDTAAEPCGV
jgi:hypothetical protein